MFDISLDTANRFYAWGWKASILGAAITLFGVLFLMWGTNVREYFAGPRHLSSDQQERLSTKLTVWAIPNEFIQQHASVSAFPETKEGTDFATDILSMLKAAGWSTYAGTSGMMGQPPNIAGVVVRTSSNPRSIAVADALVAALEAERVTAVVLPEKARGCEEEGRSQEYMAHEPACSMIQVMVRDHP